MSKASNVADRLRSMGIHRHGTVGKEGDIGYFYMYRDRRKVGFRVKLQVSILGSGIDDPVAQEALDEVENAVRNMVPSAQISRPTDWSFGSGPIMEAIWLEV